MGKKIVKPAYSWLYWSGFLPKCPLIKFPSPLMGKGDALIPEPRDQLSNTPGHSPTVTTEAKGPGSSNQPKASRDV